MSSTQLTHRPTEWFDHRAPALLGSRCSACDVRVHPPRAFCWRCASQMTTVALPALGRVRARSRVLVAPPGFPDEYTVAVVDLADGTPVVARLDGVPEGAVGVRLTAGPVRSSDDGQVLGPVFVPAEEPVPVPARPAPDLGPQRSAAPNGPAPFVAGVAVTRFGRHDHRPEQLAADAVLAALGDAGVGPGDVDAMVVGSAFLPPATGQRMLRHLPFRGIPVLNVENACASGTSALLEAVLRARADPEAVVVAVGVDAPLSAGGGLVPLDMADPLAGVGVTLPALYALAGDEYLRGTAEGTEAFAEVVVRSRRAAAGNPAAYRREPVDRAAVLGARSIAEPLTLLQCSPNADGAAAAVVLGVAAVRARTLPAPPVEVAALRMGAGLTKDRFTGPAPAARVSALAYGDAGIDPGEVDLVELHDAFAPAALLALENLGLAAPHTAAERLLAGGFAGNGTGACLNPSGGLLSRGHPPGATGLAQVHEIVCQLRGRAGQRQVAGARTALLHSQGGTVLELETNACVVGLFRAADHVRTGRATRES